ncbi:TonB-dependent receptor [Parerythrobacter jejuensis]|uniref:TonB-dependent receptor n=1 Tax=Parerythrobacter jejuensis TaxID=795812 RepID=A0A845AKW5_9SPHN|nr:TonB-dependent receptor [Parerythrobacter jejuensis]MXP31392.1 TonB-dependent receptor [Parerythrobacter jejuensis]
MSKFTGRGRSVACNSRFLAKCLAGTALSVLAVPSAAFAQDGEQPAAEDVDTSTGDVIVVTGIRESLQGALREKRNADSLIEVIQSEDIGKLPDQNLAEVLENITGIQITRTAGVGTGVQIRGTNDNRVEINGVSSVGSGTGRGGINFEDINAAIIAAVEVVKAPEASTIEGSVGGTINLRTIRPLDLSDQLLSVRVQGEYSELSDSITPRFSASYGNNWSVGGGEIGIVLSGSYTEQEATSFRPRVDRDNLVAAGSAVTAAGAPGPNFDYLGIQFLNQERENFEYETINFAGSLEWAPNSDIKVYFDAIINDQERRQDSSRIQGSGVSALRFNNVPSQFETVNFGSLDGVALGSIEASLVGTIQPNLARDDDDPNLRFSSDTGARVTDSKIFRLGTEFETGRFTGLIELSTSRSDTTNPNLSTTLNFINPNPLTPLDGSSNDNSVPFIYDLSGGALTFGVDFDSPFAPTVQDLLNPANTVLDAVTVGNNQTDNKEDAFRLDGSLDLEGLAGPIVSFDAGYRYNKASSKFDLIRSTFGTGAIANSPNGSLFADLLVPGPSNFGAFDGRALAFRNFLLVDPNRSFSDREGTLAILQAALDSTPGGQARIAAGGRLLSDPSLNPAGSFDISETTHAVYGQLNFEMGRVRGNVGLRWVNTDIDSQGTSVAAGVETPVRAGGSYQEFLPRVNIVADLTDDIVLRASYTEDINRPDFNDLSLSVNFPTGPNNAVALGNSNLAPETVQSYDASVSWYFAPSSVFSVGFFHKKRTNLFVRQVEDALEDANGFRDITAPCEGGGIFNPLPDRNVLSNIPGNGLCVPLQTIINDTGSTTQTGVEVAFQYDLSQFEDTLGFASGFGFIANYTWQEFGGGEATNSNSGRGEDIFQAINPTINVPVEAVQGLLDFSENAYNATIYYEKYGISARARYTWRDAFRTLDTAAGASLNSTLGFPVVTDARGQLNASINYDVTEWLNIGVEGVNLTKSKITQYCVNQDALLCFQGLPDRRITFGASVRF